MCESKKASTILLKKCFPQSNIKQASFDFSFFCLFVLFSLLITPLKHVPLLLLLLLFQPNVMSSASSLVRRGEKRRATQKWRRTRKTALALWGGWYHEIKDGWREGEDGEQGWSVGAEAASQERGDLVEGRRSLIVKRRGERKELEAVRKDVQWKNRRPLKTQEKNFTLSLSLWLHPMRGSPKYDLHLGVRPFSPPNAAI